MLIAQVAFGTFIFSGALAPYSSQGVGLVLFGNFAACLIVAIVGGYRGAISGLSPVLVMVMATIASTMAADGEALFATTACALIISAVATGMCCLLVGRFGLADLLRFIPYPVAGGFVAGIGGAVCLAAMSLMGANPDWRAAPALVEPTVLWTWLPGTAYGMALYGAMRRWRNPVILPASVVLAVGAYHLALSALDISGGEARAAGLLLTSTTQGSLWPALWPADLAHVDWPAMAGQIPNMLTLIVIALICVIMNVAGLEVAVDDDLDWDREFRATGVASIVAGLGGGTVATVIVPASLRSKLFHATTRLTGVIAACVIGAALVFGDGMLELVPTAFVGGILVFAGLGMLDEGLVRSRKRLPWSEYAIIPPDLRRHHHLRPARGCGCRRAGHPRVLRRASQPGESDCIALHRARAPEQQGPARSPIGGSSWRRATRRRPTGSRDTSSSAASVSWPIVSGSPWTARRVLHV